jgi:hypothetical protein
MIFNSHNVLICGAGQLGSRYLQGLSRCNKPLSIRVQDISIDALLQAEQRWIEAGGLYTHHKVVFHAELACCPPEIDLVIVATTAHIRPDVVRHISQQCRVRNWILEKVLAQNSEDLFKIQNFIGRSSSAWVNTPRRIYPWYQAILERLNPKSSLHLRVVGGQWGLACNAVHFLDFMAWSSGESINSLNTTELESTWFHAKRYGNWEISGVLLATYKRGSSVKLISNKNGSPNFIVELADCDDVCRIDELNGIATFSDGSKVYGSIPHQSEITGPLVDEILNTGNCQLPTLKSSIALHQVFIDSMLEHWRRHNDPLAAFIPIT